MIAPHFFVFAFLFFLVKSKVILSPIVEFPLGKVEGTVKTSVKGKSFFSFEGVPYAKPPVGSNRFEAPLPVEPWTNTLKADKIMVCLQYQHRNKYTVESPAVIGSEDCLYLNIYSPTLDRDANLDVIVFIHGGAFMFNHGGFQRPGILMNNDVVYVNINYRVGPLGFLSTEDNVVPGNNGLKDQIAAVKWVKENIKYFGGNPNSITITGNSAGGASVQLFYLMKPTRGLFQRGISESGCALNAWVIQEKALEKSKKLASLVDCPTSNTSDMIECMKNADGKALMTHVKDFMPWLYNPFSPFGVVVDTWASEPLLDDHPYELLRKKMVYDVPWMISHVASEGLYPGAEFYTNETYLNDIDTKWDELAPLIFQYTDTVKDEDKADVAEKIRKHYIGDEQISKKTFNELIQAISDRLFVVDIHKAALLQASATTNPVYMYYFTYRGAASRSDTRTYTKINFGSAHGDDISYIMQMKLDTLSTENDRKMSDRLVNIWLNFAKTGNPNISQWSRVNENISYLKIAGPDDLVMENENLGHPGFWSALPIKENEKLFNKQS